MARYQFQHPVFLLDGETNGYGVMRSLRQYGIKTYIFLKPGMRFEQFSRFPTAIYRLTGGYEGYFKILTQAAAPFVDHKPVLVLTTDLYLDFVQQYYAALKEVFLFEIPPQNIIKEFLEKDSLNRLAAEVGFKMPLGIDIAKDEDVEVIAQTLSFPVIVKPPYRDALWNSKYPSQKAFVASDAPEFVALCFRLFGTVDRLIVQEWVSGPDSNIYFCLAYIKPDGKVLSRFSGRKIHQIPILLGSTASAEAVDEPVMEREALRILTQRGNYGFCSVEFKKHSITGEFYVIEPTVGRIDAQEYTAMLGGVNIVLDAYLHLTSNSQMIKATATPNFYYIDELSELRACFDYRALGKLRWRTYFSKLRKKNVRFMYLNFSDPVVSVLVLAAIAKHVFRQLRIGGNRPYLQRNGITKLIRTYDGDVY